MTPLQFFEKQITSHNRKVTSLGQRSRVYMGLRLVLFILTFLVVYLLRESQLYLPVLAGLAGMIAFLIVVLYHRKVDEQKEYHEELVQLNRDEIKRLYGELPDKNSGKRYLSKENLFSKDFDIFGKNSLFHRISRCFLPKSNDKLAGFLVEMRDRETVLKRQAVLKELTTRIEWTQSYQALLKQMSAKTKSHFDVNSLKNIATAKKIRPLAGVLLLVSLTILTLYLFNYISVAFVLLIAIINYAIMIRFQGSIFHLGIKTDVLIKHIQTHIRALEKIYKTDFSTSALQEVTENVNKNTLEEIRRLQQTLRWLDSRGNLFYGILNAFLVLDLFTYSALTSWIDRNKSKLSEWLDVVYEMEMFASLAAYCYQNSEYNYPQLAEEDFILEAEQIGHPLIRKDERVLNDFSFNESRLYLLTGSNMSGKSTFLRTLGINTIMAWVGLPVCAESFTVSRYLVFSSMRTQDDLSENTSSFYAELRRIKLLFSLLENTEVPVFYFLDEILKGTNSEDRHNGAVGMIKRLLKSNAIGFISTHDLELAEDYDKHREIQNLSFNSKLQAGELLFDYKLYYEKCTSTNATQLMKNMGIIE